jgi:hypothetical protein
MKPEIFYPQVARIFAQAPEDRYRNMASLHKELGAWFVERVRAISAEDAARRCPEGRTLAQVVGHIMEWDRYFIISAGEILAGVEWPGIMAKERYVEIDGTAGGYSTFEEFNARQAAKHASWPWDRIRDMAIDAALLLQTLFTAPGLLTARRLEATRPFAWRVPDGPRLTVAVGWFQWMVTLEHEAVDHETELASEACPAP